MIKAFIAVEDKEFFNHNGFNAQRITIATIKNLYSLKITEGASTITQQYAKMSFLSNEKSFQRKIKEISFTLDLEARYSKKEILEGYLNNLYFGSNVYGIFDASLYFFGKTPQALSISETCVLVGMIKGPAIYSPFANIDNSLKRRNLVLDILYQDQQIDYETLLREKEKKILLNSKKSLTNSSIMYYKDYVLKELEKEKIQGRIIDVYTHLDYDLSIYAEGLITKYVTNEQVGIVAIEPNTGYLKCLIGGTDYYKSSYNRSTQAKRQIGSTVKPFLYYEALLSGFTPLTTFLSSPTNMYINGSVYSPTNYNDLYEYDRITLAYALATSDNIYAVKTHLFIGMNNLTSLLKELDFGSNKPNPTLTLGTTEASLLTLTSAYNTLASMGFSSNTHSIKEVYANKKLVYEEKIVNKKVLNYEKTFILNYLLTLTFDTSLSRNISVTGKSISGLLDLTYAGKIGSTDYDNYMMGFNPYITLGVWTGYDDNLSYQSSVAKLIWANAVNYYNRNNLDTWYQEPNGVKKRIVDPSGLNTGYRREIYY